MAENYILENDEWKFDIMPEIIDGKNITDFIDPDIEEKLEALEREEEKLEAEGFYDSEEDMVGFHPSSRLNFALFRSFSGTRMTSAKPQRWKSRKGNASTHKW